MRKHVFLVKDFVQQQNIGWKFEVSWFSSNSNTVIQQKIPFFKTFDFSDYLYLKIVNKVIDDKNQILIIRLPNGKFLNENFPITQAQYVIADYNSIEQSIWPRP